MASEACTGGPGGCVQGQAEERRAGESPEGRGPLRGLGGALGFHIPLVPNFTGRKLQSWRGSWVVGFLTKPRIRKLISMKGESDHHFVS